MICPNCGKEMKSLDVRAFSTGPEPDYDWYSHIGDECKKCKIKYNESTHSWELPDNLKPTEKQLKTVLFIENRLSIRSNNLITKKQYFEFIKKYFEQAKHTNMNDHFFIEDIPPDEWE